MMTSGKPTVSAIIAAFNAESTIAEAIESVLSQSYASIECIVVDDGSTDGTVEVIKRYGPSVHLLSQPNSGVSAARNRAAARARGVFLAFIDADDVWLPDKTLIQMQSLIAEPEAVFSYSAYWLADNRLRVNGIATCPNPTVAFRNTLSLRPPGINLAQTGVLRTKTFHDLGGFDEGLSTSADLDLVLRVASAYPSVGVPRPLAIYRRAGGQMSSSPDLMRNDMEKVLDKHFSAHPGAHQFRSSQARLHAIIAKMQFRRGSRGRALSSAIQSILANPPVAFRALLPGRRNAKRWTWIKGGSARREG